MERKPYHDPCAQTVITLRPPGPPSGLAGALESEPRTSARHSVDVLNVCVTGYDTLQEARLFERIGAELEPDLIVVRSDFNDMGTASIELSQPRMTQRFRATIFRVRLVHWVAERYDDWRQRNGHHSLNRDEVLLEAKPGLDRRRSRRRRDGRPHAAPCTRPSREDPGPESPTQVRVLGPRWEAPPLWRLLPNRYPHRIGDVALAHVRLDRGVRIWSGPEREQVIVADRTQDATWSRHPGCSQS